MSQSSAPLVVRQQERFQCAIRVELRVAPEDASRVTLSSSVGAGGGLVRANGVDCSMGGMGVDSPIFFPKTCRLRVRVIIGPGEAPVECLARVQRAWMQNRTPTYYLGLSFLGSGPEHDAQVKRLLAFAAPTTMTRSHDVAEPR